MGVPDYQSLMLPLLQLASDGRVHRLREAIDALGNGLQVAPEDRKQLLPSGVQRTFDNRVSWAKTYLAKAGLLENVGRGSFRITPLGLEALREAPQRIDAAYLERFPAFLEFRKGRDTPDGGRVAVVPPGQTPEETLEGSYQAIRDELARNLLERVKTCSPAFFETLVVDLLVALGYGGSRRDAGEAIGQSGDEGVDGIIKEDKLGLDIVYVQAKRWGRHRGTSGRTGLCRQPRGAPRQKGRADSHFAVLPGRPAVR